MIGVNKYRKKNLRCVAFRMNFNVINHKYNPLMQILCLTKLEIGRNNCDVSLVYKIINNTIDCFHVLYRFKFHVPTHFVHNILLHISHVRTNCKYFSCTLRISRL